MKSPLSVTILLHYFYSPTDWPEGVANYPRQVQAGAMKEFVDQGLLREVGPAASGLARPKGSPRYEKTEALEIYVKALLSVPYPVQKWVIPGFEGDGRPVE